LDISLERYERHYFHYTYSYTIFRIDNEEISKQQYDSLKDCAITKMFFREEESKHRHTTMVSNVEREFSPLELEFIEVAKELPANAWKRWSDIYNSICQNNLIQLGEFLENAKVFIISKILKK